MMSFQYWHLINKFEQKAGYGVLVTTSFKVKGKPMVGNPDDRCRCFMATEMDFLAVGNYLFDKKQQEKTGDDTYWQPKFELD